MKTEDIMRELRRIEIVDNCHTCQEHGCQNADSKPVPCNHVGDCTCDDHCICECHHWERIITLAHNQLAVYAIKELKEAA